MNIGTKTIDNTQLSNKINSGNVISAASLDDNNVFIAHSYDSKNYLYGMVCTINGTTITKGIDTILSSASTSGQRISAVKLSNTKVFVARSDDNLAFTYGMICSISGTTITLKTDARLTAKAENLSVVALTALKVLIIHDNLYGMICTINNDIVTLESNTKIGLGSSYGKTTSVQKILSNKVVIIFPKGDYNKYLYGMVCTIEGTVITAGTETQLSNISGSGEAISTSLLFNTNVFISHSYNSSNYYLYGIVCAISGTNITKGTDTQLSNVSYSGYNSSSVDILTYDKVFIAHSYNSDDKYLHGMVCKMDGTTITKYDDIQLSNISYSGYNSSIVGLTSNNVFIAHSYDGTNYCLHGTSITIEDRTNMINKIEHSTDKIFGIAKIAGNAGDIIEIYTPKI